MTGMPADANMVLLTAVRQFAAGSDSRIPDASVVDEAERMVRAAFPYAVDPECHYLNDGALGFLLPLPNGDLVMAALRTDGVWLWGHAADDLPDDGRSYLAPGSTDEILAALAQSAALARPAAADLLAETPLRRPRPRSRHPAEPDAGPRRGREHNASTAAA